jgi:hypothetical protein
MPKGCVRPLTTVDGEMGVGTRGRRRLRIDVASRHHQRGARGNHQRQAMKADGAQREFFRSADEKRF